MSIPFHGTRTRSNGVISAIAKQLRQLSLKPVKSIHVKFDPFHNAATEVRDFFFHITTPKIIATNPRCIVRPQIVSDLSEPLVKVQLQSGDNVIFKSTNLTSLNILQLYNEHITSLTSNEPKPEAEGLTKKKQKRIILKSRPGAKRRRVYL